MSVLTCRIGLYLCSRLIDQFFKGSIRLWWSEWLGQWIFRLFFNFIKLGFDLRLSFLNIFITNRDCKSSLINWNSISVYISIGLSLIHSWNFDGRIPFLIQKEKSSTSFVRTASIESLHLSLFYSRFLNVYFLSENGIWLRITHC